ncbi:substrate-binding domain-containing protein [Chloroflexota bacterium]
MKKLLLILASILLIAGMLFGIIGCSDDTDTVKETEEPTVEEVDTSAPLPAAQRLRVATTTSLYDTGLWGYLEPMFEEEYGVEVDVMYAGTGKAIEYGQRGDVDVITVHSKSRENAFVADGYGIERIPFAYNYFLIVGPESDPAGIKGMLPEEAFEKLMSSGSGSFVSRGDDSGTHGKEKSIWSAAGYEYAEVQAAGEWYIEAGTGMGPTLTMASEKQAYTLTDIGTYLSYKGKVDLVPIVDKGSVLLNVYSVLVVNPDKVSVNNAEMAQKLADFLVSPKIQDVIDNYGLKDYGMHLFNACAGAEPTE